MKAAVVMLVAVGLVACGGATTSSSPRTSPTASPPTPTATARAQGFHALDGLQLPGTSADNWGQLAEPATSPGSATDMEQTSSNDLSYSVALFNFSSSTKATAFYNNPPAALRGFIAGALGYAPITGSTGEAAPSKGLDLRSCTGEGSGPSFLPTGQCSDGNSFSVGVATILQRGSVVIFVGYLTGSITQQGNPSNLARVQPYANDALQLLSSVGL
jgi:hypothetical protein